MSGNNKTMSDDQRQWTMERVNNNSGKVCGRWRESKPKAMEKNNNNKIRCAMNSKLLFFLKNIIIVREEF